MAMRKKGRPFEDILHEDRQAPANLPQKIVHEEVSAMVFRKPYEYDGSMAGIDECLYDAQSKVDRSMRMHD